MTRCAVQASGAIELSFYGELDAAERAAVEAHLRECTECAHALEELRVIREALASRSGISAPESGDWRPFMARLDAAIETERSARAVPPVAPRGARRAYIAYLAMAALLALVTVSVTVALQLRRPHAAATAARGEGARAMASGKSAVTAVDPADFAALSEEHFERSKLVVLGLAAKDPADHRPSDWAYERELASTLLDDTRMYRLAAEDRGLMHIAGVMRDLEMVLLQTSMTDEKDPGALPQLQRLIEKRDLLEKMDAVAVPATDRAARPPAGTTTGTKGL